MRGGRHGSAGPAAFTWISRWTISPVENTFLRLVSGADNYRATVDGANAQEAQMRLYAETKAIGRKCWPVWQGRVRPRFAT